MNSSYAPAEGTSASAHAQESAEQSDESPEGDYDDQYAASQYRSNPELWSTPARKRGRHPKDPHAEQLRFDCKDVDDLEEKLREYLKDPSIPAEHATIEFHFPSSSAFMVYTRDFKRDANTPWTSYDVPDLLRRTAVSVHDVMQPTENSKDEIVRQKAVGRICVEAIQRADGFRYSFHNNWLSREDKAHRFSFFCNDSTLNKGRAAGGGQKGSGKAARKPIYECNGLIAIKFSLTKNNLEVHYRHVPVHKTYEERAPPPRKSSKRYRLLELLNPDALPKARQPSQRAKIGRPRKNKMAKTSRDVEDQQITGSGQDRDRDLQPLIDFIGMADGVVPGEAGASDSDSDGIGAGDGGVAVVEDNVMDLTTDRNSEHQSYSEPVFPPEQVHELDKVKGKYRKRKRAAPEVAPTESAKSGGFTWTNTETPRSFENSMKGITDDATTINDLNAPTEPKTELEALKEKLLQAEERIQKLEAAKTSAPYPYPVYPPYPYPYPYPYPPPPPGYGYPPYPPYPPPTPGPPTNSQPPPPPLQTQHQPSPMGPPSSVRSPYIAVSPAYANAPSSANPTLSPAYVRPPNSANVGLSPTTPNTLLPQSTSANAYSPTRRGSAATNLSVSSPHPKQNPPYPSPVTPVSATPQYPLGGILVPIQNSATQVGKINTTVPKGVSLSVARNPPPSVDHSKELAVHYSPVPTITAASWEPVLVGGSSRHHHPDMQKTTFNPISPSYPMHGTVTPLCAVSMSTTAPNSIAAGQLQPVPPGQQDYNDAGTGAVTAAGTAAAVDSGDDRISVLAGISEAAAAAASVTTSAAVGESQEVEPGDDVSATDVEREKEAVSAPVESIENHRHDSAIEETAVVVNA